MNFERVFFAYLCFIDCFSFCLNFSLQRNTLRMKGLCFFTYCYQFVLYCFVLFFCFIHFYLWWKSNKTSSNGTKFSSKPLYVTWQIPLKRIHPTRLNCLSFVGFKKIKQVIATVDMLRWKFINVHSLEINRLPNLWRRQQPFILSQGLLKHRTLNTIRSRTAIPKEMKPVSRQCSFITT